MRALITPAPPRRLPGRAACSPRAGRRTREADIRASSRSTKLVVEVEERQRLEPVGGGVGEQPAQRCLGDRPPAEARDHRVGVGPDTSGGWMPASAAWTSVETIPPMPTASAFSSTTTRLAPAERRAHGVERERAEGRDPDDADLHALLAQLIDGVLDRAEHRAERDDDRLGVVGVDRSGSVRRSRVRTRRGTPRRSRGSARAPASAWRARGT